MDEGGKRAPIPRGGGTQRPEALQPPKVVVKTAMDDELMRPAGQGNPTAVRKLRESI